MNIVASGNSTLQKANHFPLPQLHASTTTKLKPMKCLRSTVPLLTHLRCIVTWKTCPIPRTVPWMQLACQTWQTAKSSRNPVLTSLLNSCFPVKVQRKCLKSLRPRPIQRLKRPELLIWLVSHFKIQGPKLIPTFSEYMSYRKRKSVTLVASKNQSPFKSVKTRHSERLSPYVLRRHSMANWGWSRWLRAHSSQMRVFLSFCVYLFYLIWKPVYLICMLFITDLIYWLSYFVIDSG